MTQATAVEGWKRKAPTPRSLLLDTLHGTVPFLFISSNDLMWGRSANHLPKFIHLRTFSSRKPQNTTESVHAVLGNSCTVHHRAFHNRLTQSKDSEPCCYFGLAASVFCVSCFFRQFFFIGVNVAKQLRLGGRRRTIGLRKILSARLRVLKRVLKSRHTSYTA